MVENLRPMLNKGPFDEGVAVNLRLMDDPRGADRGPLVNLQDFITVTGEALSGDNQAAGEDPRLVGQPAVAAYLRTGHGDVVTNMGVVADAGVLQPGIAADEGAVADGAGAAEPRVAFNPRAGENGAVGVVDPALSLLAQGRLVVQPAALAAAFDVGEIT